MDIVGKVQQISILVPPILLAVTIHELAHGFVADRLGDPTPRLYGRLTLNPFKHLDLWGTLVFLITGMIGWAKPVPINGNHFKNPRKDMFWVALAGPASNIFLAFILAILYRFMGNLQLPHGLWLSILKPIYFMLQAGVVVNLGLACFNLLPIPPLDGSHLVEAFLPWQYLAWFKRLEVYG
ncbi:MAG: site-2 protease family protein, partial [Candidatus Desulfofervidaceae bacterium]|nr:site-2 protease family protein [Candidatus Desulfofervidaceae bacterium]